MAHKLNFYNKPSRLNRINYELNKNTEFIITSPSLNYHSELQNCVIALQPPFTVAKIHAFRTQAKNVDLAERQERERRDYLEGLSARLQLAEESISSGYTVRELIEQEGARYDEEQDEMRLVAKVPGLNIYLEVLGVMDEEDTGMERWWAEHPEDHTYDRAIDEAIARQLQRMAYFMTTAHEERDRRTFATMESDWQPRKDWQEEYDPEEWWQRPERKGIGFTHTDPARRGTIHVKHTMTEDEQAELARLKQEAESRGETLDAITIRRLKLKAVANVAAHKYVKPNNQ